MLNNSWKRHFFNFQFSILNNYLYLCTRLENVPLHPLRKNRGVAQLVAFLVWDQAVAGSSPVTSTTYIGKGR